MKLHTMVSCPVEDHITLGAIHEILSSSGPDKLHLEVNRYQLHSKVLEAVC